MVERLLLHVRPSLFGYQFVLRLVLPGHEIVHFEQGVRTGGEGPADEAFDSLRSTLLYAQADSRHGENSILRRQLRMQGERYG